MKRYLASLCLLAMAVTAWAVTARHETFTHQQKDGTSLTVTLIGDEYLHYYIDADGNAYQLGADGDFYPLSKPQLKKRSDEAAKIRAEVNAERIKRLPALSSTNARVDGPMKEIGKYPNLKGNRRALILLVNFNDYSFGTSASVFQNRFNQTNTPYTTDNHIGSVKQYFLDQSYNQFILDFDVIGPLTLSESIKYYGENDANGNEFFSRSREMVKEACNLADPQVNFADYDWDGDGVVDQVFIIYAGYGENAGGADYTIWPHQSSIATYGLYLDGKQITAYGCTSELSGNAGAIDGIGTFIHEFSHCLGFPDLYDTDYEANGKGWAMQSFDIMSSGNYNGPNIKGEVPCGYSAWERKMAGWMSFTELKDQITVKNMPALNDEGVAYVIYNPQTRDEFYILENRQANRWFRYCANMADACHGLFISYQNYDSILWQYNEINAYGPQQHFTYVPADGSYDSTGNSYAGDFFPGLYNVTAFTDNSHPSSVYGKFLKKEADHKAVTEIKESNGKISFKYDGGSPEDDGTRYKIKLIDDNRESTWIQGSYAQSYTLPSPTGQFADWEPKGWSYTEITTPTYIPSSEYLPIGSQLQPQEDAILYAVYAYGTLFTSHPVDENHSITLSINGFSSTWTQGKQRTYTLPSVVSPNPDWTFAGWATSSVAEGSSAPALITAGTTLRPMADATYYAVFSKSITFEANTYCLVDHITDGKQYVIATGNTGGSSTALDGTILTTTYQSSNVSGGVCPINANITINPDYDEYKWKSIGNGNGSYYLQNIKTSLKSNPYLGISNQGIKMESYQNSQLYYDPTYGLYWKNSEGTKYYLHASTKGSGAQFSVSSTANSSRVYLYELAESSTSYSSIVSEMNAAVSVTTNSLGWATFAPSYDVLMPTQSDAYVYYIRQIDDENGFATTTNAKNELSGVALEAGTGVLVKTLYPNTEVFFPCRRTANNTPLVNKKSLDNLLTGVLTDTPFENIDTDNFVNYIFTKKDSNGIGFYRWNGGNIGANKCILQLPMALYLSTPSVINLNLDDIITGISTPTDDDDDAPLYTPLGIRVGKDYKGLVIKNGKKILIK